MVFTISRKTINDFHLGLSFTVLYASINSMTYIQQMFFESIHHVDPLFNVDGYVNLGLSFLCTSLATFIAPSVITVIGWKPTLLIGAISYNYFVLYYFESNWLAYLGAILNGFGGGLLWLSQGTYMILNSEIKSLPQSVGIFWGLYQTSYFIGNAIVYFLFNDNDDPYLNRSMRKEIIVIFAGIVICAIVMFSLLRNPIRQNQVDELKLTPLGEIKNVYQIMICKDTLLHNFIYIFCGINYSFLSVMASSLGFTKYLSNNSKIYTPLSALTQGVGEIVGVIFTACLGRKSILKLRAIPLACIATMVTYIMVFLALPRSSAFTYTDEKPIIELSIVVFMIGNGLMGFGNACMQTGVYNYIGFIHPRECAPALAHFKFIRNVASAVSFYCSNYFDLQIQTTVLILFSILAFCAFYGSWNKSYSSEAEDVKSQQSSENGR